MASGGAVVGSVSVVLPPVLDVTCGGRMMWFDKRDPRAMFGDRRCESAVLSDGRVFSVCPDMVFDFRALPFSDGSFAHVVFDPPHLERLGKRSDLAVKYGFLVPGWEDDIREGFAECFRVLRPWGTLVLKWSEYQIPLSRVLSLTPFKPLYGHASGRQAKTHWVVFIKDEGDAR